MNRIDEKNFKIRLYNTFDESPLVLTIRYAEDYPSAGPPSFELFAEWLSDDAISEYVSHMVSLFVPLIDPNSSIYISRMTTMLLYTYGSATCKKKSHLIPSWMNVRGMSFCMCLSNRSRLGHSYQIKSESPSLSPQAESYEYIEENSDDDLPLSKAEQNKMNIDRFQHVFQNQDMIIA